LVKKRKERKGTFSRGLSKGRDKRSRAGSKKRGVGAQIAIVGRDRANKIVERKRGSVGIYPSLDRGEK